MIVRASIFLIAVGLSVAGSLTFWPVKEGKDFYIPIILFLAGYALGMIIWWFLMSLFGLFVNQKKEHEKPSKWSKFWLREGITYINVLCRINTKVRGLDKLPTKERFLFVCNHRSNFDPMITLEKFSKQNIAFVTKPSNFKIPLGHKFMWGLGFLPVNREDPLQSLETFKKASDRISKGYTSIGVYPEGTRHHDCDLGQFHEGVFNIALRSKCPIVIGTISGTEKITSNWPKHKTIVKLDIVQTFSYEEICDKTAKALSDQIKEIINNHLRYSEEH